MAPRPDIAVIGCGGWGANIVRTMHALGRLLAVVEPSPQGQTRAQTLAPGVPVHQRPETLWDDESVRGVMVATPAETHHAVARAALEAGKHVFVEKPLTIKVEDACDLVALAAALDRVLMVGHLLEHHPAVVKLHALVRSGVLGKIRYLVSSRLNLGKIRTEENALWSFAPHDIAVILRLVGAMPFEVVATGGSYVTPNIADVTVTQLLFDNGVRSHVFVSWLHPFKEQRLVVIGSKRMAQFDDVAKRLVLYDQRVDWQEGQPTPVRGDGTVVEFPTDEPLREECRHFLTCVDEGRRPLTDGREGLRVLRILHAAQRSLVTNGHPVMLEWGSEMASEQDPRPEPVSSEPTPADRGDPERHPGVQIHDTACIDEPCQIGEGTRIWHFTHVMARARIGRRCNLGQNVVIAPDVTLGDNVKVQNNVSIYTGVVLEDDVFCGPSMVFTNIANPRSEVVRRGSYQPTVVRRGATLGANCTIVTGVEIGRYAFVAAGAVVTRDVMPYAMLVGVPARQVGWACRCGYRLPEVGESDSNLEAGVTCSECGNDYRLREGRLIPVEEKQDHG